MKRKIPPVHLLSIFEAAARHQSFKAASSELCITPSAVSHQIKTLEENLGFELFHRVNRGVTLNSAGQMYLNYIEKGFEFFEQGTNRLQHQFNSPTLKVSCFTTMASNIIIPQLGAFQSEHPQIELRIETGNHVADLRYDDIDIAIRVGQGNWPNTESKKLFDIEIAAVCSPTLIKQNQTVLKENINQLPLIDLSYMDDIWQQWSDAMGVKLTNPKRAITFSDYDSSITAASQGVGLALAMFPIESQHLVHNTLVKPFGESIPFQRALYAVYREEDKERHDINCFINWLIKSPLLSLDT